MDRPFKIIAVICANEPVPLLVHKIELLNSQNFYQVHLIYMHRKGSLINMPLDVDLPKDQVHEIVLNDPHGSTGKRALGQLWFILKMLPLLYRIKPSAIHAVNMENWLLLQILYFKRTKYILDILDIREIFFNSFIKFFIKKLLNKTDLIFLASPKFADDYLYELVNDLDKNKVLFVPNAPYEAEFTKHAISVKSGLTIGYFGFLRGREAIACLVDVISQLNQEGLDISVHFAGIGTEKPLVEGYAAQFKFVRYFGPYSYKKDIQRLYKDIDLIYAVYLVDNDKRMALGCRYSESIVTGIPLIVQADTYMADLVAQHETGYIVKFGDWQRLKELLKFLYFNKQDIERIGGNCASIRAENLFDTYVPLIIKKYRQMFVNR